MYKRFVDEVFDELAVVDRAVHANGLRGDYDLAGHGLEGFVSEVMNEALFESEMFDEENDFDLAKAVRLNRCMREWLGWIDYRDDLYVLVGFSNRCLTEEGFARAVRRWQLSFNAAWRGSFLKTDGIVGLHTLNAMRQALRQPILSGEPVRPLWIQWDPSPNHGARKGQVIDTIIFHATSGRELSGAINRFRHGNASAHYVIARDGQVIQMVDLSRAAWHAGVRGERERNNARSVGIEIVNSGPLKSDRLVDMCDAQEKMGNRWICTRWSPVQPVRARTDYYRHSRHWDRTEWWVPYTEAQYQSLIRLNRYLVSCIPTIKYITGHEHLLKWDRGKYKDRSDPGGSFDWPRIEQALEGWFSGYVCRHYGLWTRRNAVDPRWEDSCPGFHY